MAIDDEGRIAVVGNTDVGLPGGTDFAVARILPNGTLDSDFSADGRATVAFDLGGANGSNADAVYTVTVQRDGRIVLGGVADSSTTATPNLDMAVARLLPDGSLDSRFGLGGRTTIVFDLVPNGEDILLGSVQQSDGRLVFGDAAVIASNSILAAAVPLNADGTPDATFGTFGKQTYDFGQTVPSAQLINGVALQGTKIVFGGALDVLDASHVDTFAARIDIDLIFADGFE